MAQAHRRSAANLVAVGTAHIVDLVINIPREYDDLGRPDGYQIRRRAVEAGVPLITDLQLARALVEALRQRADGHLEVLAWQDYMKRTPVALA